MHAFLMPHSLNQLGIRLWFRHILNIVHLTFILTLQGSSVHLLRNILFTSLWNLFLNITSDDCILFTLVYHPIDFVRVCSGKWIALKNSPKKKYDILKQIRKIIYWNYQKKLNNSLNESSASEKIKVHLDFWAARHDLWPSCNYAWCMSDMHTVSYPDTVQSSTLCSNIHFASSYRK